MRVRGGRSASSTSCTRGAATSSTRARGRAADGFEHIDPLLGTDPATLALPIGCPTVVPEAAVDAGARRPRRARSSTACGSERCGGGGAAPHALLEPWAGAVVNSAETVRAFRAEVPGVRLLVDTGHVADWGGDPCELLELADHVQLRQGKPGHTQVHVDDPTRRRRLRRGASHGSTRSTTAGKLSVEYFDLPENGWPLDDPERLGPRPRRVLGVALGGAGPGREREARRRHALERDEVAGERVGDEQRAQVGAAEAAVGA